MEEAGVSGKKKIKIPSVFPPPSMTLGAFGGPSPGCTHMLGLLLYCEDGWLYFKDLFVSKGSIPGVGA